MNMNDSLRDVKHDMDTTKSHKRLHHHENDSTKKTHAE